METVRGMMTAVMAMAALSEIVDLLGNSDKDSSGIGMLCGLCCAGCMLNALKAVMGALM